MIDMILLQRIAARIGMRLYPQRRSFGAGSLGRALENFTVAQGYHEPFPYGIAEQGYHVPYGIVEQSPVGSHYSLLTNNHKIYHFEKCNLIFNLNFLYC